MKILNLFWILFSSASCVTQLLPCFAKSQYHVVVVFFVCFFLVVVLSWYHIIFTQKEHWSVNIIVTLKNNSCVISLGWFACKHLQRYHSSALQFVLNAQIFEIDGTSVSHLYTHPAFRCKLQVVLKSYVQRHKVTWCSPPSLSTGQLLLSGFCSDQRRGTSQSLGQRPLVGSSRWTRWRNSGSVGTERTDAATREDCPPRSASGESGCRPCLAAQILSGGQPKQKLWAGRR